jgi:hypothetical protein
MKIQTKDVELEEFSKKVLSGVNNALRKLVEMSAANNESLVVGDKNGGFKSVPAKELLKTLSDK